MKTNVSVLITAALLCIAAPLRAETVLYTGATVHTVSGETFSPGQLFVKDGKITAVGAKLDARADKTVDLAGLHLFPGLIAAATSLGLTEISAVRATQDTTEVGGHTPDVQAWIAVNPDSELLPVARAAGITHFLALPLGGAVSGQSGLMSMTGWSTTERTYKAPIALHVFWPGMGLNTTPRENLEDKSKHKSLDEQAKDRQKKLKELDDFFEDARAYAKARASGAPKAQPDAAFNPAWEAMLAPVRGEIPLMIHADDARQIKAAVQWTTQRGYRMILAGGRDAWQVAALLASNNIPVLFENTFDQPVRDFDGYDTQFKAAAVLHQAGVKVVFSPGPGARAATFARNLPHAAAQAVAFGLPEAEALKGITLYPAQALGVADRLGSLEAGKDATFIAVDGDILDVRTNVRRMWMGGQETPLDSRHTRLYEKYKGRPKP